MTESRLTFFFDVGDTLIHPSSPLQNLYIKIINRQKNIDLDQELFKQIMQEELENMAPLKDGHFRYSDGWFTIYIYKVLERMKCPKPWKEIMDGLFRLFETKSAFNIYPDVFSCLEKVRSLGSQMAIVSNWGYRLEMLLKSLDLASGFDPIIASAEVEIEKPDTGIFKIALDKTGSSPEQTVHIGDNYECDVMGARAAGIRTVFLDRKNVHPEIENRITTLDDLFPHLKERGITLQS